MAVDLNAMLAKVAAERATDNPVTRECAHLANIIATRFREEFASTVDPETCGLAFLIAASAVVSLCNAKMPATVVVNVIALAGEQLVTEARDG